MSTYYPQSALEGFGKAITAQLGVHVAFDAGAPRTDGTTIYLPPITGALTVHEFEAFCGVALHEAAHVAIGSTKHFQRHARLGALEADCFNAVLDVADETRIARTVRRASALFAQSASHAFAEAVKADAFNTAAPHWVILALGIQLNRMSSDTAPGWHDCEKVQRAHKHRQFIREAWAILHRARTRRHVKALLRPAAQYNRLRALADELAKVIRAAGLEPPPGAQPAMPSFGGMGTGDPNQAGPPVLMPTDTSGPQPGPGDRMADDADGSWMIGTGGASGTGAESRPEPPTFSEAIYRAVRPCIAGAVARLAASRDADALDDGHASGKGLGAHIERALIDGRCFVRRNDGDGEKLHAAVLLDHSGSMWQIMPAVAAIAQAFAESLAGVCETLHLAEFDHETERVDSYRRTAGRGGTGTAQAIQWADEKLAGQRGRRLMIVITDGQPDSVSRSQQQTALARSHGIDIIGIAYQTAGQHLTESMPGARVIVASNPSELACTLARIAAQLAA